MIIGISGKIGSGKDTIAKIIQILYFLHIHRQVGGKDEDVFNSKSWDWQKALNPVDMEFPHGDYWNIKRFAGKLKQIVSLLTGVPMHYLEKEEVKNSLLPKEWQTWEITNWGKNAGLLRNLIFETEQDVKDFCINSSNSQHKYEYKHTQRTYRWLLQKLGTEALREVIHPNIHINALFSNYRNDINHFDGTSVENGEYPNWIITDVRFLNEVRAIHAKDGLLLRVNRFTSKESLHESETALDNYKRWDYVIDNNGDMDELIYKVRDILINEKIIS